MSGLANLDLIFKLPQLGLYGLQLVRLVFETAFDLVFLAFEFIFLAFRLVQGDRVRLQLLHLLVKSPLRFVHGSFDVLLGRVCVVLRRFLRLLESTLQVGFGSLSMIALFAERDLDLLVSGLHARIRRLQAADLFVKSLSLRSIEGLCRASVVLCLERVERAEIDISCREPAER